MSAIKIVKKGIADVDVDAIVNAANEALRAGGGVCGAIFEAAGYRELQAACDKIGHCDTGDAVITPGFACRAAIEPVPAVELGGKALAEGTDFTVSYGNNVNAGKSATVTVSGMGAYSGSKSVAFEIAKAANKATAKKTSVKKTLKAKALKKKAQAVALPKLTSTFGKAKWKVAAKDKKKVLSLKNGKVNVKKGAKKGKYTLKLKASVAGTANYSAASTKVVTVKVTVK